MPPTRAMRKMRKPSWPTTIPAELTGVAAIAWNVRTHLNPAMIGYIASPEPVCIAVAARRPGAMKPRYEEAVSEPPDPALSTIPPSPRPMAARNRTGCTNELNMFARYVLR